MIYEDFILEAMAKYEEQSGLEVMLCKNDETGDWVWSVSPMSDSGFWLNAFKTKKEALEYCDKHSFNIQLMVNELDGTSWIKE